MPAGKKAAAAFRPDAVHCLELGVIDGIIPSRKVARTLTSTRRRSCLASRCEQRWTNLQDERKELRQDRRNRFRPYGVIAFLTSISE